MITWSVNPTRITIRDDDARGWILVVVLLVRMKKNTIIMPSIPPSVIRVLATLSKTPSPGSLEGGDEDGIEVVDGSSCGIQSSFPISTLSSSS